MATQLKNKGINIFPKANASDISGIGDLDNLETEDKSSVVNAVNELVDNIGDIETVLLSINNG